MLRIRTTRFRSILVVLAGHGLLLQSEPVPGPWSVTVWPGTAALPARCRPATTLWWRAASGFGVRRYRRGDFPPRLSAEQGGQVRQSYRQTRQPIATLLDYIRSKARPDRRWDPRTKLLFAGNLPVGQQTFDGDEVPSFGSGALLMLVNQLAGVFRRERGHGPPARARHNPGRHGHRLVSLTRLTSLRGSGNSAKP